MGHIGFKVKIVAPYFPDIPPEIKKNWVSGIKKAAPNAYQGLRKAIKTRKDFKKKIAKPAEKAIASFINPEFVSRHELTYKNIMNKTRDSMKHAGKDYLQKAKAGFETGKFAESVEFGQTEYARKWCKITGPLIGYKKGGIKGLSALGVMALVGDPGLKNFLKVGIDTIEGTPTQSLRAGAGLGNRIVHLGREIIKHGYETQDIKRANQELNQLINDLRRRKGIVPFSPGGVSHIDFIVEEIPNPVKAGEMIKQLGLDIQISKR
jgi:hypothetical protein